MTTYEIKTTDSNRDRWTRDHATKADAAAACMARWPGCVVDGGLVWESEADASNDDGSRAVARIVEVG